MEELTVVIERVAEHQALLRENKVLTERFDEEVDAATEETKRELSTMKRLVAESIMGKVGIYSEKMKKIMQQASLLNGERSYPCFDRGGKWNRQGNCRQDDSLWSSRRERL